MEHRAPAEQNESLRAAKQKEWLKIDTSRAVKVHEGDEARKLLTLYGKDNP